MHVVVPPCRMTALGQRRGEDRTCAVFSCRGAGGVVSKHPGAVVSVMGKDRGAISLLWAKTELQDSTNSTCLHAGPVEKAPAADLGVMPSNIT